MATVKDLAAYVCDKLAGKVLIHRYDAYSTNSVYLKFDYGLGNSLRLSDHTGKAGLNYRFNIITTMKSLGIDTSGEYPRFYYPPDMVDQAIADIVKGVTEKRGRYHDYGKALETARARTKGERGFWEQARLVKEGVPPAIQYSIFEGGDVFVCPFCCADLARTEAGIPRKCPECGQPIERKQSHDRKKA